MRARDDDPEDRIRELERPLAEAARESEAAAAQPAGEPYATSPTQSAYSAPFLGTTPGRGAGNRMWWVLGTFIVVGVVALAAGMAAMAGHRLSGVRSAIPGGSSSPVMSRPGPPGGELSVSGLNQNRAIGCRDNAVSISGVSNTVIITGHCASLTVSGAQNSITVDAVDSIDASGVNNKVTYHSGAPKISNSSGSNVVARG